jgi:formate hydrogenlyase transcriptional activator
MSDPPGHSSRASSGEPSRAAPQGLLGAAAQDDPRLDEAALAFQRALADLSVAFVNVPLDQLDAAIRDGLRRIGEALDLDRGDLCQIEPDRRLTTRIGWSRAEIPAAPATIRADVALPWTFETIRAGRIASFAAVEEIPNAIDCETYRASGVQSAVVVPLSIEGDVQGAVAFSVFRAPRAWTGDALHRLRVIAAVIGGALARQKSDEALSDALAEGERLRDRLQAENLYRRHEAQARHGSGTIVGQSAALRHVLDQIHQVALTDSTVLLVGETGTGKELFASHIHEMSGRRGRPMVRVNCAAVPAALIESELFGREKGAFTGALSRQVGRFELADRSTILLDEIGDLPLDVQVKLLRVLEDRQIERLGSPKAIHVDVRIIAATHRDLEQRVQQASFREDLFYRLNVFPIRLPPLRDRIEDIPLLVWQFVEEFSKAFGKRIDAIPRENMAALQRYAWPGNIRELRNVVERAMIVATGTKLTIGVPGAATAPSPRSTRLVDVEREHILSVLEITGWRIRGTNGAADRLGLRPTTLETRMAKLGLRRPKPSSS